MNNSKIYITHSEEVQDIMGIVPHWITRFGISIIFSILLLLMIGSCFFKYPDIIQTKMILTNQNPAVNLMAHSSGKISSWNVHDKENVKAGQLLAVIENPAKTEDVLNLEKTLRTFFKYPDSLMYYILDKDNLILGDIQDYYSAMLSAIHNYYNYKKLHYYPQKISSIKSQLNKHQVYYNNLQQQQKIILEQYNLAYQKYKRDSLLYSEQVISVYEYETTQNTFLQSKYNTENAKATLKTQDIQIDQMKENLLDVQLEQMETEKVLIQKLQICCKDIISSIAHWKMKYCIYSPIDGTVTLTNYWRENQFVSLDDVVCSIIPNYKNTFIGKAELPVIRSGKVKKGQHVIIRFENYPYEEFGTVEGRVLSISLLPIKNNYIVEIELPNGLKTNYGKKLPILYEMPANAEIITEDLYLIERLIYPLKRIWEENL